MAIVLDFFGWHAYRFSVPLPPAWHKFNPQVVAPWQREVAADTGAKLATSLLPRHAAYRGVGRGLCKPDFLSNVAGGPEFIGEVTYKSPINLL